MRDKIPGLIAETIDSIRDHAQIAIGRHVKDLDGALTRRKFEATTYYPDNKHILVVGRDVAGAKNDRAAVMYRVHCRPSQTERFVEALTFVGTLHYLHGSGIAAVHTEGGAATCLCGYETPTTYRRIQQVARVVHRSHKRSAYIGKMPIDPRRVYIHPSGIPFQMPQYTTPSAWLVERAMDKEFDHA